MKTILTFVDCATVEGLQEIIDFSLVVLYKRTSEKTMGSNIKGSR